MCGHKLPPTGSHSCAWRAWVAWNEKRAVSSLAFMALNHSAVTQLLLSDLAGQFQVTPMPSRDRAGTAALCPGLCGRWQDTVRHLTPGKASKQGWRGQPPKYCTFLGLSEPKKPRVLYSHTTFTPEPTGKSENHIDSFDNQVQNLTLGEKGRTVEISASRNDARLPADSAGSGNFHRVNFNTETRRKFQTDLERLLCHNRDWTKKDIFPSVQEMSPQHSQLISTAHRWLRDCTSYKSSDLPWTCQKEKEAHFPSLTPVSWAN